MSGTQRTVRRLHLTATSRAQVRSMLPRLEDALRCASLPDDGARLLVLRRLALGRLQADIGTAALVRLIEQRVAAAEALWVDADAQGAGSADGVVLASALDARIRLALRLLRGPPPAEWYWPLAVPEAPPLLTAGERLLAIAHAVAGWPEARVALPAWAAALVRAGAGAALASAVPAAEGGRLLAIAGLGLRPDRPASTGLTPAERPFAEPHEPVWRDDRPGLPAWLRSLLSAAPALSPGVAADLVGAGRPAPAVGKIGARGGPAPDEGRRPAPAPAGRAAATARPVDDALPRAPHPHAGAVASVQMRAGRPAPPLPPVADAPAGPAAAATSRWALVGTPTAAGGLLFLLLLLARLGLPAWHADDGDAPAFAAAVLGAALRRLAVADDDPAWALAWDGGRPLPRSAAPAPPIWHDTRLARHRDDAGSMPRQLAGAIGAEAQVGLWLDACRRWLRRVGGIGLASLVLRPGDLALTATHADAFFRLDQTDLRVRRLGLDLDLGWLPWFGRVVAFHYRQEPR